MSKIGEIKTAPEIGFAGRAKYVWHPCPTCGKPRWVFLYDLNRNRGRQCKACAARKHTQSQAIHWKGGKLTTKDGYTLIRIYPDNPFYSMTTRSNNGNNGTGHYIREHRLIMAQHLGRLLSPKEDVHHLNGNRSDNRLSNLQLTTKHKHPKSYYTGYKQGYKQALKDLGANQCNQN